MVGSVRYQGFPDGGMVHAKQPVRVPPSADVQDVTRFFRKDSPTQFRPEHQAPPSPMKQESEQRGWLPQVRGGGSPPPQDQQKSQLPTTLSPHYDSQTPPPRQSNSPNIPNLRGEMSSAEMKKKRDEAEVARENYNEDLRRKEMYKEEKREEQKRAGTLNRKMKFTEHQLEKPGSPKYNQPVSYRYGEDRGRSPMKERPDSYNMNYSSRDQREGMLERQEQDIGRIQSQIDQLKEQRAMDSYRGPEPDKQGSMTDRPYDMGNQQGYGFRSRSVYQADFHGLSKFFGTLIPNQRVTVGILIAARTEPMTERPYNQGGYVPNFDSTPRRKPPAGDWMYNNSVYMNDFNLPYGRARQVLGNPNREGPAVQSWPFQRPGGGAPMANQMGQRCTRIQGTMNNIGVMHSNSAHGRRPKDKSLLEELNRQREEQRAKRMEEERRLRQPSLELAADMRGGLKVGYPRYLPNGQIAQHHLSGAISNPHGPPNYQQQTEYRESLNKQTRDKQADTALAQLEATQQANKHHYVFDSKFGRLGGGNRKGVFLGKVNLDRAIHRPEETTNYQGGAPYASHAGF